MGAQQSIPEPPPPPEPMLSLPNVKMAVGAVAILTLLTRFATLQKNVANMSARGKNNCLLSTVGIVASIAAASGAPAETYVSVESALAVANCVFVGFYVLFLFMAEFFFSDNFAVKPKDNFGLVFTRMFGVVGLWSLWVAQSIVPSELYAYYALYNACIIYVGPQRGEMLLPTNEKHIVPHIGTTVVGLALFAALL